MKFIVHIQHDDEGARNAFRKLIETELQSIAGLYMPDDLRREVLKTALVKNYDEQKPNKHFIIGQRVLLNDKEVGTVVAPENNKVTRDGVWVFSPSNGFASCYDVCNVKPLPGGQL